ncbi:DUF1835 domain-containing protein [Paracnuella aquatica]|uniref:DUF1835 domain-containing protein n=1 Tax=Paracnuella aquatica TaxID=2268757 RepID=UPI000DEF0DF9|nr:DUF1835 domain-containing protein [Paracnuella aquatica]RPD46626.1 DUF1835 domain-containing protein [Paracnuella aquatica]
MSKESKKATAQAPVPQEVLHLVFQEADIAVLQSAAELDETLKGEIIIIRDDFAVGPLYKLDEAEGWQARKEWWKEQLLRSPYGDTTDMVNDRMTVHNLKKALDENEQLVLWMWMGQNSHDVCGYYWLIGQLKEYGGRVYVLYMNNLPFINEKGGIFYPTAIHEIPAKEFRKAKKLARTVTPSEFEVDPDEWKRLSEENGSVRILEGGKKIATKGDDFYDAPLLQAISADWQKIPKVLFNALGKMKIKTGDVFLNGRLKALADEGKLELQGDFTKGWKDCSVKLAGVPAVAPATEQAV